MSSAVRRPHGMHLHGALSSVVSIGMASAAQHCVSACLGSASCSRLLGHHGTHFGSTCQRGSERTFAIDADRESPFRMSRCPVL